MFRQKDKKYYNASILIIVGLKKLIQWQKKETYIKVYDNSLKNQQTSYMSCEMDIIGTWHSPVNFYQSGAQNSLLGVDQVMHNEKCL